MFTSKLRIGVFIICSFVANLDLAYGKVLLVASKNTSLEDYKIICAKNNYLCFPNDFNLVYPKTSQIFNELTENFDLDNKDYVSHFSSKLSQSLKEDDLSLDQIKKLIHAAEKVNQLKESKLSNSLLRLKKIYTILDHLSEEFTDRIIVIAGKSIANTTRNRQLIEPYINEVRTYEVDYVSYKSNNEKKFYLNGDCSYPRYTEFVSQIDLQVIPHFSEGCNFSQKYNWGSNLMESHFKENKNIYFAGLAAVATALFLKSYDVSILNE